MQSQDGMVKTPCLHTLKKCLNFHVLASKVQMHLNRMLMFYFQAYLGLEKPEILPSSQVSLYLHLTELVGLHDFHEMNWSRFQSRV